MSDIKIGCRSEYVLMRDGVRLAVSAWLGEAGTNSRTKSPAILITTRYWRAMAFKEDNPEYQDHYPLAAFLWAKNYVLVVADARGTGASFGVREAETSATEVDDIGEVIDWAAQQDWCDGRVATVGTSYMANTTLLSLATGSPALKIGVCRAPDFDCFRHILAPGGIINSWFVADWGAATAAQDKNDIDALLAGGYWPMPSSGADNALGVRPVDQDVDGTSLRAAVNEHKENFNVLFLEDKLSFIDTPIIDQGRHEDNGLPTAISSFGSLASGGRYFCANPYFYKQRIEQSNVPVVIRCGWHDAATALGALSLFTTFNSPVKVIIGPWNHTGDFLADPFQHGDGNNPEAIPMEDVFELITNSLDSNLKKDKRALGGECEGNPFGVVEYYTLGEKRWKVTNKWPLPTTQMKRFYLSADHQLSLEPTLEEYGSDIYQVNLNTGTGLNDRWHASAKSYPIFFPDRQEEDKKLLVYDSAPLDKDVEITGHPVVHLFVRSTATDGQFFAYMETIDPDGRVRLLTEGELRALHRKVSGHKPPFKMFGPYHSLLEEDAEPLTPGEVAEITFDLLPISVLLKKGQRIRLAIAGANKDVFAPIPGCESPEIMVERNSSYASFIDLPFV